MHLVVTHAFAGYARGDAITDAAEMAGATAEYADYVVAVASTAPLESIPETAPEAAKE